MGMAACPISWPQMQAFFAQIQVVPENWELRCIELLDNAWLESQQKK